MKYYRRMMQSENDLIKRIIQLPGYGQRKNDVLFVPRRDHSMEDTVVVYFGGDIQDFAENMREKKFVKYCLENVATLLHRKFRGSHVLVIRPSRYYYKDFSCFDNFVPSGKFGIPSFVEYHNALSHLQLLLDGVQKKILEDRNKEPFLKENVHLEECRLKLIGFSKGCAVLNQFLHEFHFLRNNNSAAKDNEIVSRISDMYFLDGGHSGKKNIWIVDRDILQTLVNLGINIYVHVTPYQVKCNRRPWIGEEEKIFYETLTLMKANIVRHLHFENETPSLDRHFEMLNEFS